MKVVALNFYWLFHYIVDNETKIECISKLSSTRKNQVILLMITDSKK